MQSVNTAAHGTVQDPASKPLATLTLGALGVVFGDIGTSPLYTLRECFAGHHPMPTTPENVLGVLSLITWALIIVVLVKYVIFIMRADNNGEGGILALLSLTLRAGSQSARTRMVLILLALMGAALFYGDGVITPAISVLSAVEGLNVAAPGLESYVIPITLGILVALFVVQRQGTASVGTLFGPVMLLWFVVLGALGIGGIVQHPEVLAALNPLYAAAFILDHQFGAFLTFGAVVLAVTGGEALYTDMGHFGRKPIRIAFVVLVFPCLLLNYYGQGGLLVAEPAAIANPFYHLVPDGFLYPMIALATAATVIASQAVISGVFSVTQQAILLGYCPRMHIRHTSHQARGQIYIPTVNTFLLIAVIGVVLIFQNSSNLAAAYGIAVTATMAVDTILGFVVARTIWGWSKPVAIAALVFMLGVDLTFFSSNLLKFFEGGWFPILLGGSVFLLLSTWRRGREILAERLACDTFDIKLLVDSLALDPPTRVQGTAVFMTSNAERVPPALLHNMKHNKVVHERNILLTVRVADIPAVDDEHRIEVEELGGGFWCIVGHYGYMEAPDVPSLLELCTIQGLYFDLMDTTFFLSRERIVPNAEGMSMWRERIFGAMSRNAIAATEFYNLPSNRVVEMGAQVSI